ncbi:MAG: hypothetical protein M1837_006661 [Sclerophora amabilis]|nr:MAG: hypothetical protein M1837_006661 [Sclerophora amabilis]
MSFYPISSVSTPESSSGKSSTVCVFCGSSAGNSPAYLAAARSLAQCLHANNINLVYGGGTIGLMGEVARTLVSLSGPSSVHGIIPSALIKYEQSSDATSDPKTQAVPNELIYGRTTVVQDMHTRKQMMAREVVDGGRGGGFVALPGGYGTLEELMEMVTWNQLGIHAMGIVVFNVDGYYDGLMHWVKSATAAGFVSEGNRGIIVEAKTAEEVVKSLTEYKLAEGRYNLEWAKV